MKPWFPARACEVFPFPLLSRQVDGIRGRWFRSLVEGTLRLRIEVATAAHTYPACQVGVGWLTLGGARVEWHYLLNE